MSGNNVTHLLDSNAVIAFTNEDPAIVTLLKGIVFGLPIQVVGEMYFGAYKSQRLEANIATLHMLLRTTFVFPCTTETAHWYGQIRAQLRTQGRPIPENDIWIAACALENQLPLVTRDAHFAGIADLRLVRW